MFKKIEIWVLGLICVIFFIILVLYGAVLRHELLHGGRFPLIQKTALFLAEIPKNLAAILYSEEILSYTNAIFELLQIKVIERSFKLSNKTV